jgi:hypothetical protein
MWVRFRFCWARRRADPNSPAPPLPDLDDSQLPASTPPLNSHPLPHPQGASILQEAPGAGGDHLRNRYPFIDFHYSPEEAVAMMNRRLECQGEYPESEAKKARERMLADKARMETSA